ncbi:MAG: rRNA maturation RNase YbeY [Acidobacteria bacterium]|nr:rRNA maturation RNase YbeY [Acidobacteriota bacterium]
MIDVINLQRKVKLDLAPIRAFANSLSASIIETNGSAFTVAFISDDRMRQLNEMFRGKDSTTDVLSFPNEPDEFEGLTTPDSRLTIQLGDIVISAEQAQKQSVENGLSLEAEIKQLILHGVLHLCGYDHEADNGEMNARELDLRDKLGIDV